LVDFINIVYDHIFFYQTIAIYLQIMYDASCLSGINGSKHLPFCLFCEAIKVLSLLQNRITLPVVAVYEFLSGD
jgi:hypothetical protein